MSIANASEQPAGTVESVLRHPFLKTLSEPPSRRRAASPFYMLALMAVAGLMLLLPAIYLLMIVGVGWLTWWHATNDAGMFEVLKSVRGGRGSVYLMLMLGVLYVGPIVAGVVAVLFMVKPLFAPQRYVYAPQAVTRRDQPLLFAYVDKLCDTLGALRPAEIHIDVMVNASASFREGLAGFVGGQTVLTVGLPLVAGTTLREFTGILAHEFGHFAQRGGMRARYVVHRINVWFARVAYERDAWDDTLDAHAHGDTHWSIQLIAHMARFVVWLSRRVLAMLMYVGHLFCAILMRQGEYDADRAAVRIVGSRTAVQMLRRVPVLDLAGQATFDSLDLAYSERRMPDNLPAVVAVRAGEVRDDVRKKIIDAVSRSKTGWFDTHPSDSDRIRAMERAGEAGLMQLPESDTQPASALFANFDTLCKLMTRQIYADKLGPKLNDVTLVSVGAVAQKGREARDRFDALDNYLSGLVNPVRPVFLPEGDLPRDRDALAERLFELRSEFNTLRDAAKKSIDEWAEAQTKVDRIERVLTATDLGLRCPDDYRALGLTSSDPETLRLRRQQLIAVRDSTRKPIDDALRIGLLRMKAALALGTPAPKPVAEVAPEEDFGAYDLVDKPKDATSTHVDVLRVLRAASADVEQLRQLFVKQTVLMRAVGELIGNRRQVGEVLGRTTISGSKKIVGLLGTIRQTLRGASLPTEGGRTETSLAGHVVESMPVAEEVGSTYEAAEKALDRYYGQYQKSLAVLAAHAAAIEAEIGL
ncbi:MAG: M48 family metalloprotease [Tepidisphaeraceae bacterium]